jgi:hypothetical protein
MRLSVLDALHHITSPCAVVNQWQAIRPVAFTAWLILPRERLPRIPRQRPTLESGDRLPG